MQTETLYRPRDVLGFFGIDQTELNKRKLKGLGKSDPTLERERSKNGELDYSYWIPNQLPKISETFGFLNKDKHTSQKIVTIYNQKGGVGKSTFTFNLVRCLAAHNFKVLVIGLDKQGSITNLLSKKRPPTSVEEILAQREAKKDPALYEYFQSGGKIKVSEIIKKTEFDNLDYIPENENLFDFQFLLNGHPAKTNIFKNVLVPELKDYDFIILDCKGEWSDLSSAAIIASHTMISPIACELLCYQVMGHNYSDFIMNLKKNLNHNFKEIYVANLLDNSANSKLIYDQYKLMFEKDLVPYPIKRAVSVQEALTRYQSVIEYDYNSEVAAQYRNVVISVYDMICG